MNDQWFGTLVSRCQLLAGRSINASGSDLIEDVRHLPPDDQRQLSIPELLLVRRLLAHTLIRLAKATGIDRRDDVRSALLEWSSANIGSDRGTPRLDASSR